MKILNSMKKSQFQKCLKVKNYNLKKSLLYFFNSHSSLLYVLENLIDSLLDLVLIREIWVDTQEQMNMGECLHQITHHHRQFRWMGSFNAEMAYTFALPTFSSSSLLYVALFLSSTMSTSSSKTHPKDSKAQRTTVP